MRRVRITLVRSSFGRRFHRQQERHGQQQQRRADQTALVAHCVLAAAVDLQNDHVTGLQDSGDAQPLAAGALPTGGLDVVIGQVAEHRVAAGGRGRELAVDRHGTLSIINVGGLVYPVLRTPELDKSVLTRLGR